MKNFYHRKNTSSIKNDEIISDKQNNKIINVSKKTTSNIETRITNEDKEIIDDELNDFKASKKKTPKPNLIINYDSNETQEKKIIKKIRIKKSNNHEIWWTLLEIYFILIIQYTT